MDKSTKNSTVAALLCFFFGSIGLHEFYCGRVSSGFIRLLLGVLISPVSMILVVRDMFRIGGGKYTDVKGCVLESVSWAKVLAIFDILGIIPVTIFYISIVGIVAAWLNFS